MVLECDHIVPVAEGGQNAEENLATACFDCNRGKSDIPLTSAPRGLAEKAEEIREREEQLAGYRAAVQFRTERIENDMWLVADALDPGSPQDGMRRDWLRSIKMFNERLPLHETIDAAEIALSRHHSKGARFRYFCGICWNKIREAESGSN